MRRVWGGRSIHFLWNNGRFYLLLRYTYKMKLVHYPNNTLHTEILKCSECSIIFSSIAAQLDLPQSYTACTIHLQKEQLFIFREGTYIFSSNNPAEKEILCKIFSFEGKQFFPVNLSSLTGYTKLPISSPSYKAFQQMSWSRQISHMTWAAGLPGDRLIIHACSQ